MGRFNFSDILELNAILLTVKSHLSNDDAEEKVTKALCIQYLKR